MNSEWNIKARGETCGRCGKAFQDEQPFMSRLVFAAEGYQRLDACLGCWQENDKDGALSVWKSVFKLPPPPPPEPLKKETAESLLRQLMETDDPAQCNVIYILAVMLERRRVLVERDVQIRPDGLKVRFYEHRKTGETFVIPDPELRLAELESVQHDVLILLEGQGGDPAAAAPVAPPAEGDGRPPEEHV